MRAGWARGKDGSRNLAEREGFEPPVAFDYARFPGVCLKPLSHLSAGGRQFGGEPRGVQCFSGGCRLPHHELQGYAVESGVPPDVEGGRLAARIGSRSFLARGEVHRPFRRARCHGSTAGGTPDATALAWFAAVALPARRRQHALVRKQIHCFLSPCPLCCARGGEPRTRWTNYF